MLTLAYFGIESSGLNLVVDLLILFVVVLYLSLIYWTYADARRRIDDPMLVGCATAASLFPFVGTIVYMILRPPEYLEDVRERELEMQAAEARLHELDHSLCPHCDYRIERDFVRCPSCLRKLKDRCVSCSAPARPGVDDLPVLRDRGAAAESPRRTRRTRRTQASIDAEQAELAQAAPADPAELVGERPETARAKVARERREREAASSLGEDRVEEIDETQATPVVASEPAARPTDRRSASAARPSRSSSGRTRPST